MIQELFCLYDTLANRYFAPSCYINEGVAKREVSFLVNNDPKFKFAASEYELVKVGLFNLETGEVKPADHSLVCKLSSLLERNDE